MAKTDLQVLMGALKAADEAMTTLFVKGLARDIGQVVLNAAGPDGTVPVERLGQVQAEARRLVDAAFLGPGRSQPFNEQNQPVSPFAEVIAEGQLAMIDAALNKEARMMTRMLPEDVRQRLVQRYQRSLR